MQDTKELLKTLCSLDGTSGDESSIYHEVAELLAHLGSVKISPLGSVVCDLGGTGPVIMLTAHIDRIGMIVTRITDEGFVKMASVGGVDRRSVAAARVKIQTAQGEITGVIGSTPPHLKGDDDKQPKIEDLYIDLGMEASAVKEQVKLGDRIVMAGKLRELLNGYISAPALDNRAGCAAVIQAATLLRDTTSYHIVLALTSMEETGGAGAVTSAFDIKPEIAFVVDVSMGLTPDDKAEKCGVMGKGPMIGISPILSRTLSKQLITYCEQHQLPYQLEIMPGATGTDADGIAVTAGGVKTALLSIPLLFMHSPVEVVKLEDVEAVAKLIAGFVKEGLVS